MSKRVYPQWFVDELVNEEDKERARNGMLTSKDKVLFKCGTHGVYEQMVGSHIKISTGEKMRGCPVCGQKSRYNSGLKKLIVERVYPQWFIDSLVSQSDRERAIAGNLKTTDEVMFNCKKHGPYKMMVKKRIVISTGKEYRGCPKCGMENKSEKYCTTLDQKRDYPQWFLNDLANDEDKIRGNEIRSNEVVEFKCDNHGKYKQLVSNHINISTGERLHGCPVCVRGSYRSSLEMEIEKWLKSLGCKVQTNVKGLVKSDTGYWYELDLFLSDLKIAIEVNGSYFHQTVDDGYVNLYSGCRSRGKTYHFDKFLKCKELGIHLIQIFDIDWYQKRDKILNYLKNLIVKPVALYARNFDCKRIDSKEAREFCNKYHLQGGSILGPISYGLFLDDELYSVMTFGNRRFRSELGSYELHRYCVKSGVTIVGGANKLLKSFEMEFNPQIIVSYSDNDYFTGGIYPRLGFVFEGYSSLSYYWYKSERNWLKREQTQVKDLSVEYPELYEKSLNQKGSKEDFIMRSLGYIKVYRSGNKRWVKSCGE